MGTGISKRFSGTRGSDLKVTSAIDLFSDKSTDYMKQANGEFKGNNFEFISGGLSQNRENDNDEIDIIFKLFVFMCYMLKLKWTKTMNKKTREFLNEFEKDGSNKFRGFLKFKDLFNDKKIGPDYGYDVVKKFIDKNFFDSSGSFLNFQKNEWVAFVNNFWEQEINDV